MQAPSKPAPRRKPHVPIRVETFPAQMDQPRFLGYAGNLSQTGAFLQCSSPRRPGSVIRLRLHLRNVQPAESVCCDALVVWTRSYHGRHAPSPGMGVRFLSLSSDGRTRLQRFCE